MNTLQLTRYDEQMKYEEERDIESVAMWMPTSESKLHKITTVSINVGA